MSAAAGGAAAAHQVIVNAIRSFGVICTVDADEFQSVLKRSDQPLVLTSTGGLFVTQYLYLTSYKGIAFYCRAKEPLELPNDAEIVQVNSLMVPG